MYLEEETKLAGMERTNSRSITRGRAGGGSWAEPGVTAPTGDATLCAEGRTALQGPDTGVAVKGRERMGSGEGRGAGSTDQRQAGRESDLKANRDRLQTRRKKMRKKQESKLAWACVRLHKNSIFC